VTYTARDGLKLEGLLVRPLEEEPGKKYPLILTVHGGPEAHFSNGWLTGYANPGQVGAARGFAVFYPNYRGSTGRGVEFSKLGQADYGGKEFDDLVDAVDHLINTGLVDKEKVGVTGGSYGGFATAWCSTYYSNRFAAGVMFVGIADHASKTGTTDIPHEMALVHARKYLWEDWEYFVKRSPIYYVEKARTPLLILHGKDDPRVHPSQSLELYRHLKTLKQTPVRLVWYPGEGHGNRKAAARYDYNLRMMQWFEHYLKGPGGEPPDDQLAYPLRNDKTDSPNDAEEK
jgi:dipeptidyl aminopeptidase/acylaminoacyl peptidase